MLVIRAVIHKLFISIANREYSDQTASFVCLGLFTSLLYLNLYLLDDTWISFGSFMRTILLFVLIHIRHKGEVGTVKHV